MSAVDDYTFAQNDFRHGFEVGMKWSRTIAVKLGVDVEVFNHEIIDCMTKKGWLNDVGLKDKETYAKEPIEQYINCEHCGLLFPESHENCNFELKVCSDYCKSQIYVKSERCYECGNTKDNNSKFCNNCLEKRKKVLENILPKKKSLIQLNKCPKCDGSDIAYVLESGLVKVKCYLCKFELENLYETKGDARIAWNKIKRSGDSND